MSDRERFEAKVDRSGGPDACHLWTASTRSHGYGSFWFQGKNHSAHRVAFFLAHGRWPDPCALHRCDNQQCVNEGHLFEGTDADNMADKMSKGRHRAHRGDRHWSRARPSRLPRGERNGNAKLTEQDVRDIRESYQGSRVTLAQLSARFGVAQSAISRVIHGKRWAHIGAGTH